MGNTLDGDVYIIAATKDGQTEYWAAATPRQDAVAAVLNDFRQDGRPLLRWGASPLKKSRR
jgi:hypothetical protein